MDDEVWTTIEEFPEYEVSSLGRIFNRKRDLMMKTSQTNHGHIKITLKHESGERYTRSVAMLVAEAFVTAPNLLCNQLILLDGNLSNVKASNLAWRPAWFAWKYTRQLKEEQPLYFRNLRVANMTDNVEYSCIVDAGMFEGLLFADIWRSTYTGNRVFPTGSVFEITERV